MRYLSLILLVLSLNLSAQKIAIIQGNDTIIKNYPRKDLKPIDGLGEDVKVYFVSYANKPSVDYNKYRLKAYGITTELHTDGKPYPDYIIDYYPVLLDTQTVILNYRSKFDAYLNEVYPEELKWQHSGFGNRWNEMIATGQDVTEYQHIRDSIMRYQTWITEQRQIKEQTINTYKELGIFPNFNLTSKP